MKHSNDILEFLEKREQMLKENENFKEWNKNNALSKDDKPVLVFHGAQHDGITEIDEDKFFNGSAVLGGLYLSDSILDVNNNYVAMGSDLINKMDSSLYEIENVDDLIENEKFDDDFIDDENYDFFKELFESGEEVTKEELLANNIEEGLLSIIDTKRKIDNKVSTLILNTDNQKTYDSSDVVKYAYFKKNITNIGMIQPFYVKMKNPCKIGFYNEDTKFYVNAEEIEDIKDFFYNNYDSHAEIDKLFDYLINLDSDFESIKNETIDMERIKLQDFNNFEKVYDTIIEFIDDYFEDPESVKQDVIDYIENNCKSLANIKDGEIIEFEDFIYGDEDFFDITESKEYKLSLEIMSTIRESLNDLNLEYEKEMVYEFIDEYSINGYDELEDTVTNYETLFNIINKVFPSESEHEDLKNDIVSILKENFDGIKMNASEYGRKNNWNLEMGENTIHYIVYDSKNIKSALSNNGNYNISNNNVFERISNEYTDIKKYLNLSVIEREVEQLKKKWVNAPRIEIKDANFFKNKNIDAITDLNTETIYLNKEQVKTVNQLEKILTHEIIGHYGIHKFVGNKATKILEKVEKKYSKEIDELQEKEYKHLDRKKDKLRLAEEFVAFKSETMFPNDKLLTKARTTLKSLFIKTKKMLGFKTNENEDVFLLLKESHDSITNKKKKIKKLKL